MTVFKDFHRLLVKNCIFPGSGEIKQKKLLKIRHFIKRIQKIKNAISFNERKLGHFIYKALQKSR